MRRIDRLRKGSARSQLTSAALAVLALLLGGSGQLCLAGTPSSTTFSSPEQASDALLSALQRHDERELTQILGASSKLVNSDDKAQDTLDRARFVQKYQEMHRFVRGPGGVAVLHIGAENWPFPIPLKERSGIWRFDADDGAKEILFRRIGENEMTTIGICHLLFAAETHPGADHEADDLANMALHGVQNAKQPAPVHGYYYRTLSHSGDKFAVIAYPALYRSSGVMTFIVTQDDSVLEKDLGPNTTNLTRAMTSYLSDETWTPAESEP
jgi:hypothetical protein